MTQSRRFPPGLYARRCHFEGTTILVLFPVSADQLDRWRRLAVECERLGALELCLADATHPGFALAIEARADDLEAAVACATGWPHAGIGPVLDRSDDWVRVDVERPGDAMVELYGGCPAPEVFTLLRLDLLRVSAKGYVQPTLESADDDDGRLAILSPVFELARYDAREVRTVAVGCGLGVAVADAA